MSFESKVKDMYKKLEDEHLDKGGYKAVITVEKASGKKLMITTVGKKGRVLLDDFDRAKILKFVGRKNFDYAMTEALMRGEKYASVYVRSTVEFVAPDKSKGSGGFNIQVALDKVLGTPKNRRSKPVVRKKAQTKAQVGKIRS